MARRIGVALVAIPAAVACHDPVSGGPDRTVRVETADPWSGGEVVLYSAGFVPPAEPAFTLDGEPLVQRRVNDTTVAARLPDRPGTHGIMVRWGVNTLPVGPLRLRGFGNAFRGPALKGIPQVWPGGGVTSILLADAAGLVRYDVTHNLIAQRWPDSLYAPSCNFSPARATASITSCSRPGRPPTSAAWSSRGTCNPIPCPPTPPPGSAAAGRLWRWRRAAGW